MRSRVLRALLFATLVLAGCATMDPARLTDLSIRVPAEPLRLLPDHDVFGVRADLIRATHTEVRTSFQNGKRVTNYVTVPNPYSELVLDFGNGIILDYNYGFSVRSSKLATSSAPASSRASMRTTLRGYSLASSTIW